MSLDTLNTKKPQKILLSIVISGLCSTASASDFWNCAQTDRGWDCTANPNPPEEYPEPATPVVTQTQPTATLPADLEPEPVAAAPAPIAEPEPEPLTKASELTETEPAANEIASDLPESKPEEVVVEAPVVAAAPESVPEPESMPEPEPEPAPEPRVAAAAPREQEVVEPVVPVNDSDRTDRNLDWVTYAPMDAQALACKGRYVEPDYWKGLSEPSDAPAPIYVDADQSSSELGGITTLRGNLLLQQPGRRIEAEYGEFDSENSQAILRTDVRLREPGFLMTADSLSADLNTDTTIAGEARYVLHGQHMRGDALILTRFSDQRIETEQSYLTFCEPGNDNWGIRSSEMNIYPEEGYGEAWNTRFEIEGVPVFYLPYFYFPIDDTRRSGFLYPSLSSSEENGYDLAIPYYFNIAPNMDDTLTTRIIEQRGLMLENEFRYLNSFSMNQLNTTILANDDLADRDRWLFNFDHSGSPAPRWSTDIDFTRVSDNAYFDDLSPVNLQVPYADDLSQKGQVSFSGSTYTASALVHDYQTLSGTKPYARMPQLTLNGAEDFSDIKLGYLAQYTEFDHDTLTDGSRTHLRPSLNYDFSRPWGFVKPEVGIWHSDYDLSSGASPDRTVGFASLDSGLVFERQGELGSQTLEPRVKLINVDGDDTSTLPVNFDSGALGFSYSNLFDTIGYTGNDQIAHTQQATLGLSSRIYSLSGREVFSTGIAQAHYFDDNHDPRPGDSIGTADRSDLAFNATWRPTETLQLSHDSRIDETDGDLLTQNYRMFYYPDQDRLLYTNLRINESSPNPANHSRQIDVAGRWPISSSWSVIGRWTEDLENSENLETLLGAEYKNCCWKVRLTGQRYVVDSTSNYERENAVYLQFVLRGLGALGQSEGRQFLEDLTGFDEDNNANF